MFLEFSNDTFCDQGKSSFGGLKNVRALRREWEVKKM